MKQLLIALLFLSSVAGFSQSETRQTIFIGPKDSIAVTDLSSIQTFKVGGVRYYNPTPENDTIYFSSEQPATPDQVSIIFQTKTNQDIVWIDWGEDAPVFVSGTTDQTKTSDYSTGSTTYNIKIYGDVDKITKFSVTETYVTFGDMSNNIGKMTGLTYLKLQSCSGVSTCNSSDIPTGLTIWQWISLPNLTGIVNSSSIPKGLTIFQLVALPKLTITVNSQNIPTGLTIWQMENIPNLTANGLSITALSKALSILKIATVTLSTARVDELLSSMDTFYAGANLMTANAAITLNGTGVGVPTGGASNTNILSLTAKATGQDKMWTFLINTTK